MQDQEGIDYGYIPDWVVERFNWPSYWSIDSSSKLVILNPDQSPYAIEHSGDIVTIRSRCIAETCQSSRVAGLFAVLKGWRNELYAIYGPDKKLAFTMERSASPLFGIVTYGVHMTGYVNTKEGLKIWVPRRAKNKQTYPGMMDNTVAGGIAAGEEPFECMVREAAEEASLPESLVRPNLIAVGTVSYFTIRGANAGGETGLLQPECQYCYDLEIPEDVICRPADGEAEDFRLLSVAEVQECMKNGDFKANCALVLLDFFVRKGILTTENERDYAEIVTRLHRRLEFPMP